MSSGGRQVRPLESALLQLRAATAPVQLPLALPDAPEQRQLAREIVTQLED